MLEWPGWHVEVRVRLRPGRGAGGGGPWALRLPGCDLPAGVGGLVPSWFHHQRCVQRLHLPQGHQAQGIWGRIGWVPIDVPPVMNTVEGRSGRASLNYRKPAPASCPRFLGKEWEEFDSCFLTDGQGSAPEKNPYSRAGLRSQLGANFQMSLPLALLPSAPAFRIHLSLCHILGPATS